MRCRFLLLFAIILAFGFPAFAQAPVAYRLSFPQPEQRWMAVEVTFPNLPAASLAVHISRSSPGRYALHEFTKNVYDVRAFNGRGATLTFSRPSPDVWEVAGHDGTVRVTYKVFGDRVDGTYLAVDRTHAHINVPAALMWARGLEARAVTVRFDMPPGRKWKPATQLHPTTDPSTFSAANLQYLMDSPIELSDFALRTFTVDDRSSPGGKATFRVAVHHTGSDADVDAFAADVQKIVRQARGVFGEFPSYEPGSYTFIADYVPYATGDGMEHRNSTVLTSSGRLRDARRRLLDTVAHEFFHCWNVERIRPKSLEPFRFDGPNPSGELWLAEGFTSYYEPLLMRRAGLNELPDVQERFGELIGAMIASPAPRIRTAEENSLLALIFDGGRPIDRANDDSTYLSYYTWGAALGLALDLSLRGRSSGRVTLDDYMRVLWQKHGKPAGQSEGAVANPYTIDHARALLGEVAGDRSFADDFFRRFVQGHEVPDYAALLAPAGLVWRTARGDRGWAGEPRLDSADGGVKVASAVVIGSPLHEAGIQQDDVISSVDGTAVTSAGQWRSILERHRTGDRLRVAFVRREGEKASAELVLRLDPTGELTTVERAGQQPTSAQRAFRDAWLGAK